MDVTIYIIVTNWTIKLRYSQEIYNTANLRHKLENMQ